MNRTWIGAALGAAIVAASCGQGRAIFNVDAYSFLKGSGKDTVPYAAPPLASNFGASTAPQKISLVPGLSSSGIDTVQVTGTGEFRNASGGPGTIKFQVYLASDSAGTYASTKDSLLSPAPSATISGANTAQVILNAPNLSPAGDSLFSKSQVWVRIVASVSNTGATLMQGKAVLTGLQLHVVVQDKLF